MDGEVCIMSILKFKNADGTWNGIAAFKGEDGKDGAIQYKAGYGINISEDNTISSTLDPSAGITVDTNPTEGSVNPVSSGGVYNALSNKANKTDIPTDLGNFTNGPGYITEEKEEAFNNSTAASITAADISNWNSKQPAGNYITPDYLTANIISDLVKAHSYNSTFGSADTGSYTSAPVCAEAATLINNIYNSGRKGLISIVYSDGVSDIINNLISINTTLTSYNLMSPRYNTFIRIVGSWNSNVFTCTAVYKYKLMDNYYLSKTNTTAYTPTSDYHPATKLYVDNKVSEGLAGSGFLSEEADPTVPTWVKSITENDILNWNNKVNSSDLPSDLGDLTNNAGYIKSEDLPEELVVEGSINNIHGRGNRILNPGQGKFASDTNIPNENVFAIGEFSTSMGYNTIAYGSGAVSEGYNSYSLLESSSGSGSGTEYTFSNVLNASHIRVGSKIYNDILKKSFKVTKVVETQSGGITYRDITVSISSSDGNLYNGNNYIINSGGKGTHSEGSECQAIGNASHAEGSRAVALGFASHAQNDTTTSVGSYSHSGGQWSEANAECSIAHGRTLINNVPHSALFGKYATLDAETDADVVFAIGNGNSSSDQNIGLKLVGSKGNTKLYVEDTLIGADPSTYAGFDNTKTQVLKNINGVFTWVNE